MEVTSKRLMALVVLISAVGFGIGAAVFGISHLFAYGMGVLIGMVGSCLRVIVLDRGAKAALEKNPRDADNFIKLNSFLRLGIAAASLGLSLWLLKDYGLYGAFVGIISMSLAAYIIGLLPGEKENRELLKRSQTAADPAVGNDALIVPPPDEPEQHPEASSGDV